MQVIDVPSSSSVPQDDDKVGQQPNEHTCVSQAQMEQAQYVDSPQPPTQVIERRITPLLQAHSQDLVIGSPSKGVMTRSQIFCFIY